jgi:hypothetical protein
MDAAQVGAPVIVAAISAVPTMSRMPFRQEECVMASTILIVGTWHVAVPVNQAAVACASTMDPAAGLLPFIAVKRGIAEIVRRT